MIAASLYRMVRFHPVSAYCRHGGREMLVLWLDQLLIFE
jgi:protein tyrosine phosphatase (PTP) superfamily phosphohydrolase (DUF442 family)